MKTRIYFNSWGKRGFRGIKLPKYVVKTSARGPNDVYTVVLAIAQAAVGSSIIDWTYEGSRVRDGIRTTDQYYLTLSRPGNNKITKKASIWFSIPRRT